MARAASSVFSLTLALLSPILSSIQVQVLSTFLFNSDFTLKETVGNISLQALVIKFNEDKQT